MCCKPFHWRDALQIFPNDYTPTAVSQAHNVVLCFPSPSIYVQGSNLDRQKNRCPEFHFHHFPQSGVTINTGVITGIGDDSLYSGGVWFEFRPGYRLLWLKFFMVFLRWSRRILGAYLEVGHARFLPQHSNFSFINILTLKCIKSELFTAPLKEL
jgi:hypothetical protein